jgi:hypothetical protein
MRSTAITEWAGSPGSRRLLPRSAAASRLAIERILWEHLSWADALPAARARAVWVSLESALQTSSSSTRT